MSRWGLAKVAGLAKSHDGLVMSGALAALAFKPDGLPRRRRATASGIAIESAGWFARYVTEEQERLARRLGVACTRTARVATQIRALRLEQLALRYGRGRIEDHIRALLRGAPHADHLFAGAFGPNLIVNAGEAFLVDAWQNLVELEIMKFHGVGTGAVAAAETDTALGAESTTILNPDSTRATGSLTEASASVFRSVGTNTFDGAGAITEWGLFSLAGTGTGTMWSRVVFAAINVASADSIQTTYDLTVE